MAILCGDPLCTSVRFGAARSPFQGSHEFRVIVAHPLEIRPDRAGQRLETPRMQKNDSLVLIFCNGKGTLKREYTTLPIQFMRRAIALGLENVRSGRGGPFAALVVKDGNVVAEGANCVTRTNDPTAHAEVVAIREACRKLGDFRLSGCDIYTTCEPCPMCLGAIYWARPARVYFASTAADAAAAGFDDAFIYDQIAMGPGERKIPFQGMMREESLACFREWKQKQDRVEY